MNDQINMMQEMVRRTEIMLTEMKGLLEQAKQEQVSSKTLSDEEMRELADVIVGNIIGNQYAVDLVSMDTCVSGMNIEVELEWSNDAESILNDFVLNIIRNHVN
jgi:hypothetical protein